MEIFDKLFTYVDNSSDLTQSMLNNYKNSLIVLGDQKQMYIPILNSYVGLGMDAYNYLLSAINDLVVGTLDYRYTNENHDYYPTFLFEANSGINISYVNNKIRFNPAEEYLATTYFIGTLKGNAYTANKLKESIELWGNTFDGTEDINKDIIPLENHKQKIGSSTYYFAYAYIDNVIGNSISSNYSTYSYTSYLGNYTYQLLINSAFYGLYPISFVNINDENQYFSYNFVTSAKTAIVPYGFTESDLLDIHNNEFIRFKEFNCGLYWYESMHTLFSTYFRGMLLGVASYADALYTPRKINGTYFDGSEDIITTYWGNTKIFTISDYEKIHYGEAELVNGYDDVNLKLPNKIKIDIDGKSTYSSSSDLSNRTYKQTVQQTNTNLSYNVTFTNTSSNTVFAYSYVSPYLQYNPSTGTLSSTYINSWLHGTADTAIKLLNPVKINGTYFDGSEDIITTYWGTTRNITISDYYSTYTYTNTNIDGGDNFTLKLPDNIHANINGNSDTSTYSVSSFLSNQNYKNLNILTSTNQSYYVTFSNKFNTYAYTYINSKLYYNPKQDNEELTTTYIHATRLLRGQLRARNQWGILGDGNERPLYTEPNTFSSGTSSDSGGFGLGIGETDCEGETIGGTGNHGDS